jgi:hypothetical protein
MNSIASHQFDNEFYSDASGNEAYYTVTGSIDESQHSINNEDNICHI